MRRDVPSEDGVGFANPFTPSDRRALDTFLEDGEGYERVVNVDGSDDGGGSPADDDGARMRRGDGTRRRDETYGDVLPGVLGTDRPSGPKAVYLGLFLAMCLYLAGYYGLSRRAGEREHAAVDLGRERGADIDADDSLGGFGGGRGDDEVGPSLVFDDEDDDDYTPPHPLAMKRAPAPPLFDPFRMRPRIGALSFGEGNDWFGSPFVPYPPRLAGAGGGGSRLGYVQNPDAVDGTVVFSTEGDIYLTRLPDGDSADGAGTGPLPAVKLTTTVGNALHPRLNPTLPHLLAYSATYSGTREVYLLDLRSGSPGGDGAGGAPGGPGGPALRLTYTPGGIRSVVGWADGGRSVLYSARGGDGDALPDVRMYRLRLSWDDGDDGGEGDGESNREKEVESSPNEDFSIEGAKSYVDEVTSTPGAGDEVPPDGTANREDGSDRRRERQRRHLAERLREQKSRRNSARSAVRSTVEPVPLAQAIEGSYSAPSTVTDSSDSSDSECLYFTRYAQSSSTKRYVGGTAPSIWSHCGDDETAAPLTSDYNGTSRHPSVAGDVLYFLSDRERAPTVDGGGERDGGGWIAGGTDLWAVPLPLPPGSGIVNPTRLTHVSCWSGGLDLSEYTVDPSTGDAVLRVGADLHLVPGAGIRSRLEGGDGPGLPAVKSLDVAVRSDFNYMHERVIPMSVPKHLTSVDAYRTHYGSVSALVTARGQSFVAPVVKEKRKGGRDRYGGGGSNMPERKYKVAPGHGGGGLTRILTARHVPLPPPPPGKLDSGERLALLLATDPLSATGEHAFYLVRTDASSVPTFGFASLYEYDSDVEGATGGLPRPFLGGHLETGGAVRDGGLGSVHADTVAVSPCGRRFAFADTDGRIVAVTIPSDGVGTDVDTIVLPAENEVGQPMVGDGETETVWSPGGRYLAVGHRARNQFGIISVADLGVPDAGSMMLGRIVPATVDRFNSMSPVWGRTGKDVLVDGASDALPPAMSSNSTDGATVLYFLSDRDLVSDGPRSPWGTRAPQPSFDDEVSVHALPLRTVEDAVEDNPVNAFVSAPYGGGGALEVAMEGVNELELLLEAEELAKGLLSGAGDPTGANGTDAPPDEDDENSPFVVDTVISFGDAGDDDLAFARSAYRLDHIPGGSYVKIVTQVDNDPSLVLLEYDDDGPGMYSLSLFAVGDWPSDTTEEVRTAPGLSVQYAGTSGDGRFMIAVVDGTIHVVECKAEEVAKFLSDKELEGNRADTGGLSLSVWPQLEHQQMFRDAWRMLRDYFYDPDLHAVDWEGMFDRYLPLVKRCAKREELDDVLRQLVGELSALHSFVYGGEYPSPNHGDSQLESINEIATLGAVLRRSEEMRGLEVVKIPLRDVDLHHTDGEARYSPLSHQALRNTGQQGLEAGDVILAVNGQNVLDGHIGSLLRNTAGQSVRLDVLRVASTSRLRHLREMKRRAEGDNETAVGEEGAGFVPEPLIVVPITPEQGDDLNYAAWEWKTRLLAKSLARDAGFGCGYLHLRDMSGAPSINAFTRDFYSDYDKEAFIIDVRNNRGGNIDSWLLDVLQRKAWMFWQGRSSNITTGGLGWDQQFAFRGHLVVLVNEHTSSDGEGFARGVSELGLGVIIGKRTWGGGIWLSSDNTLVDGGIATAAEIGTYNKNFGWGLGIEQMGVIPDVEVDNDPRMAFDGKDAQLDRAVSYLKEWIEREPITLPESPGPHRDMSKPKSSEECH